MRPVAGCEVASWSGLAGLLAGAAQGGASSLLRTSIVEVFRPLLLPVAAVWLIPVSIVGLELLVRHCQRTGTIVAAGFAAGVFFVLGYWGIRISGSGGAPSLVQLLPTAVAVCIGIALVAPTIAAVAFAYSSFVRAARFKLVEQDRLGSLCWHCGHDLRGTTSDECAECGKGRECRRTGAAPSRSRAAGRFTGKGLLALAMASTLMLLFIGVRMVGGDGRRVAARLESALDGNLIGAAMLDVDATGRVIGGWDCLGLVRPARTRRDMAILICYDDEPAAGRPSMQLQVVAPIPTIFGLSGQAGSLLVVCNLNEQQASEVLRNGVPPALEELMETTATRAGWTPQHRGMVPQPILVDPKGFWREEGNAQAAGQ